MNIIRKKKYFLLIPITIIIPIYLFFTIKRHTINFKKAYKPNDNNKLINFNLTKDLLVFLHIQKTGGSEFDRNIVRYLMYYDKKSKKYEHGCKLKANLTEKLAMSKYKKFYCPRYTVTEYDENKKFKNNWYFSRQTFGWYCGLHVDFNGLKTCMNEIKNEKLFLNKFYYITILRDPIKRYVSEWNHIVHGTNAWNQSINICNHENLISSCYKNKKTTNITFYEFLSCDNNIANNRQTRMLAEYDDKCNLFKKENKEKLLENAKNVLKNLTFFALNEYQELSQELFERTFNYTFKFNKNLKQSEYESATVLLKTFNKTIIDKIIFLNDLDIKLYSFAKNLFFKRLEFYRNF